MRLEIALAAALILAGCAQQPSPVLQANPDLAPRLRAYYDAHGIEKYSGCNRVVMHDVSSAEVVGETPTELKLKVTYVYGIPDGFVVEEGDPLMPMGEDCSGEATRDFTLAKTPTGLHVLAMTGPMRP